jgi:Thiolase C-terminal domain-like
VTHEPQVIGQSAHLWTRTDLRPADVDIALVYDGFTFNAISRLEGLGFCGFREAKDWLGGGKRTALEGELPGNPHGGQLSEARTHGFGFIYEKSEACVAGAPTFDALGRMGAAERAKPTPSNPSSSARVAKPTSARLETSSGPWG